MRKTFWSLALPVCLALTPSAMRAAASPTGPGVQAFPAAASVATLAADAWASEIRAKLTASIGDAAPPALRFAPGPVPEPPALHEGPERPPAPSAEEIGAAAAIAAEIDDPELREAVQKAAAASLARGRGDRPV